MFSGMVFLLSSIDWKIILASIVGSIFFVSFFLVPMWILLSLTINKINTKRAARRFVAELRADADARAIFRRQQERKARAAQRDDEFYRNIRGILNEYR